MERRENALRQEVRDTLEERLLTLQDHLQEARTERDRAEGLLVQLVKQLLPGERPVYLYSAGVRELDRVALNETLARHGLRVRSKSTYSERLGKETSTASAGLAIHNSGWRLCRSWVWRWRATRPMARGKHTLTESLLSHAHEMHAT